MLRRENLKSYFRTETAQQVRIVPSMAWHRKVDYMS
jgi:hypothetical protein